MGFAKGILLGGDGVVWVEPADVVGSRYHGGSWFGRTLGKLITWTPGKKKHEPDSHSMLFGDPPSSSRLISAESGRVRLSDFVGQYLTSDYSVGVYRDTALTRAERLRVAQAAGRMLGRRYSKLTIAAHALDTLLTIGGRTPYRRPVAKLVGKVDPGFICSEVVAYAYWHGAGRSFLRFGTRDPIPWWCCRPRDISWTVRLEEWKLIHQTTHGVAVDVDG